MNKTPANSLEVPPSYTEGNGPNAFRSQSGLDVIQVEPAIKVEPQDADETALAPNMVLPCGSSGDFLSHDQSCDRNAQVDYPDGYPEDSDSHLAESGEISGQVTDHLPLPEVDHPMGQAVFGPYRCEVCGNLFSMPIFLARHLKFVHGYTGLAPTRDTPHEEVMRFILQKRLPTVEVWLPRPPPQVTRTGPPPDNRRADINDVNVRCDRQEQGDRAVEGGNATVNSGDSLQAFRCKLCSADFASEPELRNHQCHVNAVSSSSMQQPVSSGSSTSVAKESTGFVEKRYVCGFCGKAFKHSTDFVIHKRIHTGEKPFVCETCGKGFSKGSNLKTHMRIHTGEKRFTCDTCGRAFQTGGTLRRHELTHTGEKPCVCDVCGKRFSQMSSLATHKRIHTGEKPYVCDVCWKAFHQAADLLYHKRRHTGEKPYMCVECGQTFGNAHNMRRHKIVHTGEKPCVCGVCGKAFTFSSNLRRHELTHSDERPHVCDICGKGFSASRYLKKHQRTHIATQLCD